MEMDSAGRGTGEGITRHEDVAAGLANPYCIARIRIEEGVASDGYLGTISLHQAMARSTAVNGRAADDVGLSALLSFRKEEDTGCIGSEIAHVDFDILDAEAVTGLMDEDSVLVIVAGLEDRESTFLGRSDGEIFDRGLNTVDFDGSVESSDAVTRDGDRYAAGLKHKITFVGTLCKDNLCGPGSKRKICKIGNDNTLITRSAVR